MKIGQENASVAIVVPVYRPDLTPNELISLKQCIQVLSNYPIIIVKPEKMELGSDFNAFPSIQQVSFPDDYFNGIDAYNRLLTSLTFYERFLSYQYILICQLDAYVFRDELAVWCKKGYDYIGAPSLHQPKYDALGPDSKKEFADALSANRVVLNGGFSLRRVEAFIRYLKIYNFFYPQWKGNEDMLFSQEATRLIPMKLFLKLPAWEEALQFAFEKSPAATYELTNHQLPFACHAWERYDPAFWSGFISVNQ
ncbi:hypothetical protein DYBT9623_03868 [Dyadobacter sp. CECT 9623]|uniref:DUF5672 domain-containing protein n=1 Tax=Dyadobacter linearis TaxID=2823330 RepID=A0ABM8UU61_9BACT|nr:DUF5672 family protein [Dyadobacter sp. CECT 9623]CAG5071892.1 hypothetical protein DYBT9623_03868 [Dyadobacter sp. CECT 9623]